MRIVIASSRPYYVLNFVCKAITPVPNPFACLSLSPIKFHIVLGINKESKLTVCLSSQTFTQVFAGKVHEMNVNEDQEIFPKLHFKHRGSNFSEK